MEMGLIILALVGVIVLFSYRRGRSSVKETLMKEEAIANERRKEIRNLSDHDLDDKLRKYWDQL